MAGLLTEYWVRSIEENLFPTNTFLQRSTDHSKFATNNKTINLPQAGANPGVTKNPTNYPLTAGSRIDADRTYDMDFYATDLIMIPDVQTVQISYDKVTSIMSQHVAKLANTVANQALYAWAPSGITASIILTTGATVSASAPAATGNRKAITSEDVLAAKTALDKQDVPQENRVGVIPSDMEGQLLAIPAIYQMYSYGQALLPSGILLRLHGFDIYSRSSVVVYDNSTPRQLKAINDAGVPSSPASTDNLGAIFYHPLFVSRAIGETKLFYNEGRAEFQGDILDALVVFGAAKLRNDQKGIVAISQ